MEPREIELRLLAATEIAHQAGEILLGHLGLLAGYESKAKNDLVTVADRESEAFIAAELSRRFPRDLRVMEEADGPAGALAQRGAIEAAELAWCVDPLDGTTSFVHSYPVFAVSIGLLSKGRPVAGVIYAPAKGETFRGGIGVAPLFFGPRAPAGVPLRVSTAPSLDRSLIGTGFSRGKPDGNERTLAIVREVLLHAHDIRRAGAAALDLCDVACGRVEGFFQEGLAPWDLAAGQAILEAAGGLLTTYEEAPHGIYSATTLATNTLIHHELAAAIRRATA